MIEETRPSAERDPAVEAARHAWDTFLAQPGQKVLDAENAMDVSIDAAREAFKTVQELHRPTRILNMVFCAECDFKWPCKTAQRIYGQGEIDGTARTVE